MQPLLGHVRGEQGAVPDHVHAERGQRQPERPPHGERGGAGAERVGGTGAHARHHRAGDGLGRAGRRRRGAGLAPAQPVPGRRHPHRAVQPGADQARAVALLVQVDHLRVDGPAVGPGEPGGRRARGGRADGEAAGVDLHPGRNPEHRWARPRVEDVARRPVAAREQQQVHVPERRDRRPGVGRPGGHRPGSGRPAGHRRRGRAVRDPVRDTRSPGAVLPHRARHGAHQDVRPTGPQGAQRGGRALGRPGDGAQGERPGLDVGPVAALEGDGAAEAGGGVHDQADDHAGGCPPCLRR